ncbi:MAG: TonB-dependent receptor [Pseudomonadota bacterium]
MIRRQRDFWVRLSTVSALLGCVLCAAFVLSPSSVSAQNQHQFDIPSGRLSSSIRALARQADITVISQESGIRSVRARAVRGQMPAREALRRLLAGTPYRAVAVRGGFRIERRPIRRTITRNPAPSTIQSRSVSSPPPETVSSTPIIVEGTKRPKGLFDYPGGAKVIELGGIGAQNRGESLDLVLADLPSVNSTALGSGRNKIFLRGIADSSFNGPTQSTIGMYLGEQRLVFSAPNPDLRLYDVESVELLEGPQGMLYGAGSIAGLLRVNPTRPGTSAVEASAWGHLGITEGGGVNWGTAGAGNLPLSDKAAIRFVGYSGEDSGFIDDPSRGLTDINRSSYFGGRGALAWNLGAEWDIEMSAFGQHSEMKDGQYIDEEFDGLLRTDPVAQPFRGRIYGGALVARGYLGGLELVSTTSLVDHNLRSVFDSSVLTLDGSSRPGRQFFRESRAIRLISHETRVSGGDPDRLSWLLGVGALRNRDRMKQLINNLNGDDPPPFANLTYRLDEMAAFGEADYRFAPDWTVTGGARLLYTRATGERSFGADTVLEPRNGPARFLPAVAVSWQPHAEMMSYVRFQQGFRTGGVTIERDSNREPITALFEPDKVRSYEAGIRAQLGDRYPLEFAFSLYHSDWNDIQADALDQEGFPITRNIGDGEVTGIEGSVQYQLPDGWELKAAATWNSSQVDRTLVEDDIRTTAIPNVPNITAFARTAKLWSLGDDQTAGIALSGRYIGRSFVDVSQAVTEEQGKFASLDFAAWWTHEDVELRLEASNLTNAIGNRFAFGNPFTARLEDQATPLRPRTIQLQLTLKH